MRRGKKKRKSRQGEERNLRSQGEESYDTTGDRVGARVEQKRGNWSPNGHRSHQLTFKSRIEEHGHGQREDRDLQPRGVAAW